MFRVSRFLVSCFVSRGSCCAFRVSRFGVSGFGDRGSRFPVRGSGFRLRGGGAPLAARADERGDDESHDEDRAAVQG